MVAQALDWWFFCTGLCRILKNHEFWIISGSGCSANQNSVQPHKNFGTIVAVSFAFLECNTCTRTANPFYKILGRSLAGSGRPINSSTEQGIHNDCWSQYWYSSAPNTITPKPHPARQRSLPHSFTSEWIRTTLHTQLGATRTSYTSADSGAVPLVMFMK